MTAAAAVLLKGTDETDLVLLGEALRSLTDDTLGQFFPNEREPLMNSIEAAFDQPIPAREQPARMAEEIIFRFVKDIHNEDPEAMAVLDQLTARVQREQEEGQAERLETMAGLAAAGLDEGDLESVAGAAIEMVKSLRDDPVQPGEATRTVIGPRGERIVIRVVSGIAAEPDEAPIAGEHADTAEMDTSSDEENGDVTEEADPRERPIDDDPRGASDGAGSGEDDGLQAGGERSTAGEDA